MPLAKKLTRIGGSRGLVLPKDILAQMGLEADDAEVRLRMVGETLVLQRADAPAPHPAEVAFALGMPLGQVLENFAPPGEPEDDIEREAAQRTEAWLAAGGLDR